MDRNMLLLSFRNSVLAIYENRDASPDIWGVVVMSVFLHITMRLNSHGRHVSNYLEVYSTLVLAYHLGEVDCKLQLATHPSGL